MTLINPISAKSQYFFISAGQNITVLYYFQNDFYGSDDKFQGDTNFAPSLIG